MFLKFELRQRLPKPFVVPASQCHTVIPRQSRHIDLSMQLLVAFRAVELELVGFHNLNHTGTRLSSPD